MLSYKVLLEPGDEVMCCVAWFSGTCSRRDIQPFFPARKKVPPAYTLV